MASSFKVHRSPLTTPFTSVNTQPLGKAMGTLKYCGLKVYLYLMGNKDGFVWTINPSVFAAWIGVDNQDSNKMRSVRKIIQDGIADLKENKYLVEVEKGTYEFYEVPQ